MCTCGTAGTAGGRDSYSGVGSEHGITYRTPVFPFTKRAIGGFIGRGFDSWETYRALIRAVDAGGDFIKIMISGLMDLNRFGVLTEEPLDGQEIRIMTKRPTTAGLAVMAMPTARMRFWLPQRPEWTLWSTGRICIGRPWPRWRRPA